MKTASGKSLFGLPIETNQALVRALIEHGDGRWSTTVFPANLQNTNPQRPTEAEITFSLEDVFEQARLCFSSNPKMHDNTPKGRQAAFLKLAAGVLMIGMASGILPALEKQEAGF